MVITLLFLTLALSAATCFSVNQVFHKTVLKMLSKIFPDDITLAFRRYLAFALYVIGIGGGVRIYDIERYINPAKRGGEESFAPLLLNNERLLLEMVRTLIETLQALAWALFVFFLIILIAWLIIANRQRHTTPQ
ncbi:MAG: hypothetical protein OEM52_00285 [bacterium]|nr:hypothetical protein [bacterium]